MSQTLSWRTIGRTVQVAPVVKNRFRCGASAGANERGPLRTTLTRQSFEFSEFFVCSSSNGVASPSGAFGLLASDRTANGMTSLAPLHFARHFLRLNNSPRVRWARTAVSRWPRPHKCSKQFAALMLILSNRTQRTASFLRVRRGAPRQLPSVV